MAVLSLALCATPCIFGVEASHPVPVGGLLALSAAGPIAWTGRHVRQNRVVRHRLNEGGRTAPAHGGLCLRETRHGRVDQADEPAMKWAAIEPAPQCGVEAGDALGR